MLFLCLGLTIWTMKENEQKILKVFFGEKQNKK